MRPNPSILWLMFRAPAGWVGLVMLVAGAVCLAIGATLLAREGAFAADGLRAKAMILAKEDFIREDDEGRRRQIYEARFGFQPQGGDQPIEASEELPLSDWRRLQIGDVVEVEYLPSDPTIARFYDPDRTSAYAWIVLAAGSAPLLVGLGLLVWMAREAVKIRRIARDGHMAAALVKEIHETMVKVNNRPQYRLIYVYDDWSGRQHQGESRLGPARRFESLRPGAGATVYFDRDDPSISAWSGDLS